MTTLRSLTSSALCALALVLVATPVSAADDGDRSQDIGVVHASGDEAWIDVPANLADTWKATLEELKERGHLADASASYVETNGQIALDTLWIAVLPGASLGAPITRIRVVVMVSADETEKHTAALVGAGAILGAVAERLPARPSGPSPYPATEPAPAATDETYVEPTAVEDGSYGTYNTYNTYNTYTTYDGTPAVYEPYYYPVYYYPSVVYVWRPWWWSFGWCHNGWWLGWSSSCWSGGWGWGWGWGGCGWNGGWNGFCSPWWSGSFCWSDWDDCDDWWDDCDGWDGNWSKPFTPTVATRQRLAAAQTPSLSFERGDARSEPTLARGGDGSTTGTPTVIRGGDRSTPASARGRDRSTPTVSRFQDRETTLRGNESLSPSSTARWR